MTDPEDLKALDALAYDTFDRGELADAARRFGALSALRPGADHYHYMRGLAHKYRREWRESLASNLQAIATSDDDAEGATWNAAIAATAIGDWTQARQLWASRGIRLDDGDGPIDDDFGIAVVRLNPWASGETVYMRRIDPVRGRLLNVPLPESGHRFGDIVLHDGAPTGQRRSGEREVSVFNALQRLEPSVFETFVAFVDCDGSDAAEDLADATGPGIGFVEDWTDSVQMICLRCSYGRPHRHAEDDAAWNPQRNVGIAAQGMAAAEALLREWTARGPGRRIESIERPQVDAPAPEDGHVWWRSPDDDEASD